MQTACKESPLPPRHLRAKWLPWWGFWKSASLFEWAFSNPNSSSQGWALLPGRGSWQGGSIFPHRTLNPAIPQGPQATAWLGSCLPHLHITLNSLPTSPIASPSSLNPPHSTTKSLQISPDSEGIMISPSVPPTQPLSIPVPSFVDEHHVSYLFIYFFTQHVNPVVTVYCILNLGQTQASSLKNIVITE